MSSDVKPEKLGGHSNDILVMLMIK